jgi:molecular chaperone DnaJ
VATTKRDYYDVLGVGRSAGEDELKRSFRKLAREYHQFGHAGLNGQGGFGAGGFEGFGSFADIFEQFDSFFGGTGARSGARRGPQRGADLRYDLEITFEEAAFGSDKTLEVPRYESCETCHGNGAEPNTQPTVCPQCNGSGEVRRVQQSVFGQFVNVTACSRCQGEGRIITTPCHDCRGHGRLRKTRKLTVKIPAGVDNGQQIRLTGEGESGPKGGPAGNLYVVLEVKPHRFFRREGSDVYYDLPISFAQAALGDEVEVPTIDGSDMLTIPAGTQTGKTFRLREKGIPHLRGMGRGDEHVSVRVRTPAQLSARERQLFEELAKLDEHRIKPNERGFFDKVKDSLGI